jgi:hypothetical protein
MRQRQMQNFTDGNELVEAPLACERPPARSLFFVSWAMAEFTLQLSKRCQGTGAGDTLFPENSLPGTLVVFPPAEALPIASAPRLDDMEARFRGVPAHS